MPRVISQCMAWSVIAHGFNKKILIHIINKWVFIIRTFLCTYNYKLHIYLWAFFIFIFCHCLLRFCLCRSVCIRIRTAMCGVRRAAVHERKCVCLVCCLFAHFTVCSWPHAYYDDGWTLRPGQSCAVFVVACRAAKASSTADCSRSDAWRVGNWERIDDALVASSIWLAHTNDRQRCGHCIRIVGS